MSGTDKPSPKEQLDALLQAYLTENVGGYARDSQQGELELEVRFGKGVRITRAMYDSTIARLLAAGFRSSTAESLLRIGTEYLDERSGQQRMSNIRAEVRGLANISTYCRTDSLGSTEGVMLGTKFVRKANFRGSSGYLDPADFWDFGFRVAFQSEQTLALGSNTVQQILAGWKENKKTFRYITRHRLLHPDLPFAVDVSTVKESKRSGKSYIPEYNFKESGVLDGVESYEIEIEVINTAVGVGTEYSTPELLGTALRRMIKLVLSGIQQTNYPTSRDERSETGEEYMSLLWGRPSSSKGKESEPPRPRKIVPRNFVGPSGFTLQAQNVVEANSDAVIPNIRRNYTVTDKADGERKLLFITSTGRLYLIDTNMNFQFTGAVTANEGLYSSVIDGEHILHNKSGEFINLYAAFDLYYLGGDDVRSVPLLAQDDKQEAGRLPMLVKTLNSLSPRSVVRGELSPLRIQAKTFYAATESQSIFQACSVIVQKTKDNLFEYETDGLIFTPSDLAVGANTPGSPTGKPLRTTWDHSLKWKPPEWNTIDFLVTVQRTSSGQDAIGNIFQSGTDVAAATQLTQYKTLILRVGFDEKRHGYINPCKALLDDELPDAGENDNGDEQGYRPMQFFPTNPADSEAGLCHVLLRESASGDKQMFAESNELIENNMIVEFKYDFARDGLWRWVPLRVRHDKTADFRSGGRNFGNAFHVANSNWHSIHNPITETMITSGEGIPDELADDDVYYNKMSGPSNTRGLRDFHNLFVKRALILAASKRGGTLIDLAVGKGGDLPKWIAAKLKFVFGIDLSRDNIENRLDGACARFLNYRKKFRVMPKALFTVGNSGVNIRSGDGILSEKGKQITHAVFGQGPKDVVDLGKGVHAQYGVGEKGFDVCSVQFALHYMLGSQESFQNFLRNVTETTKVGGYFIGTCYDGDSVFRMLRTTAQGGSVAIMDGGRKLWEVTKGYDREDFPANGASVGYAIDVYQESINKTAREFLVNFEYLVRMMDNYGLVLLDREEANELGLPASSGLFTELFGQMNDEIQRDRRAKDRYGAAPKMSEYEQRISFLNRYFIFRKVRDVDAAKVAMSLMNQTVEEVEGEEEATQQAQEAAKLALKEAAPKKRAPRKRIGRLKLKEEDPTQ
jgi:mRNA (guanine-N7-)-methyltransferase